jgi:hypothetical protein
VAESRYHATEVDTLLALGKRELISEIILLRREHHDADIRALRWEQQYIELSTSFHNLVERNEKRYDELLSKHLGRDEKPRADEKTYQPISLRKPWKQVAAEFEAKDRQEHWKQRVKEVEERDAAAMNAKETAK